MSPIVYKRFKIVLVAFILLASFGLVQGYGYFDSVQLEANGIPFTVLLVVALWAVLSIAILGGLYIAENTIWKKDH